jgi:hypothetical protein
MFNEPPEIASNRETIKELEGRRWASGASVEIHFWGFAFAELGHVIGECFEDKQILQTCR